MCRIQLEVKKRFNILWWWYILSIWILIPLRSNLNSPKHFFFHLLKLLTDFVDNITYTLLYIQYQGHKEHCKLLRPSHLRAVRQHPTVTKTLWVSFSLRELIVFNSQFLGREQTTLSSAIQHNVLMIGRKMVNRISSRLFFITANYIYNIIR